MEFWANDWDILSLLCFFVIIVLFILSKVIYYANKERVFKLDDPYVKASLELGTPSGLSQETISRRKKAQRAIFIGQMLLAIALILSGYLILKGGLNLKYRNDAKPQNKREAVIRDILKRKNDAREAQLMIEQNLRKTRETIAWHQNSIEVLTSEIRSEKTKKDLKTYEQAKDNSTVEKDLYLITKHMASISVASAHEKDMGNAIRDLIYIQRDADIDLSDLQTMPINELEKISEKLKMIIKEYEAQTGEIKVNIEGVDLTPPQELWQEIFSQ